MVKRPYCEKYKNNMFYYGACEWNKLSAEDRNIGSFLKFKNIQKLRALTL